MYITAVRLYCFRSYTELRFEPAKGLNVIVGANAAGKTNILESVFLARWAGATERAAMRNLSTPFPTRHMRALSL